jgi:GxxExxY protein
LLESAYEACLTYELHRRGLHVARQSPVSLRYDEVVLEIGFRIDLLVEDCVIVELKAVEKLTPLFEAQVMTYLKLSNKRLAILVNFNAKFLKDQLKRIVL